MDGGRTTLTVGSLCAGYGGVEMGLALAGWPIELAWVADNDPAAARVLARRHPDVPNLGDITRVDWTAVPAVDILAAGFPCTDISCAGRQAGMGADTRSGIWAHVAQAVAVLRPRLVVIENVAALLSTRANRSADAADGGVEPGPAGVGNGPGRPVLRALGAVLGDLATLGFDAEWVSVPASGVGACHRRNRVFILAWPADAESDPRWLGERDGGAVVASAVRPAGRVDLLPTPLAADAGTKRGSSAGNGLRNVSREIAANALLPTPASRDWKSGESNIMDRNARPLNEVVVNLLPTPRTNDGRGPGSHGDGGFDLRTAVALLPTPTASNPNETEDLDSWQARRAEMAERHGNNGSGVPLSIAVRMLPTPTAQAAKHAADDRGCGTKDDANLWSLVTRTDRWGQYAPAIARWEQVLSRPAPDPTELSTKGQPRLSPRFVEWMQGLPDGHVTAVPGLSRNDQLRLLGNGVVPLQCAAATATLLARLDGGVRS